jgi:putative heme iron utilization protein
MEKYEILYHDRHTEVVDHDTVDTIITDLEMFERTDISQIHLLKDDGDFETVWTEEEGLFVTGFGFPTRDDYDEDEEYDEEEDF